VSPFVLVVLASGITIIFMTFVINAPRNAMVGWLGRFWMGGRRRG